MRLTIRDTKDQVGQYVSARNDYHQCCSFSFGLAGRSPDIPCPSIEMIMAHVKQVGDYIAKRINNFHPKQGRPHFVLGLPTGSSPLPVYKRLVELHKAGKVSFKVSAKWNLHPSLIRRVGSAG